MSDDTLLKKIGEILDNKLQTLEKKLQAANQELGEKLSKKIDDSQEDTIDALSEVINTGYNLHEERIVRIETELDLPPLKQKH